MYKDHEGNITVGIGHNIDGNEFRAGVNRLAFELQNPVELKNTSPLYLKKLGEKFKDKLKTALPTNKQMPSLLLDLITNPTKLNVHFFASTHHNIIRKISFKDLILFEYDHITTIGGSSVNNWTKLIETLHQAVKADHRDKGNLYLEAVLESRRKPQNLEHPEIRNIFVAECFFWVAARYFKQSGSSITETENKLKDGLKSYRATESFKKDNKYSQISNKLENKIPLIARQA